MGIINRMKSIFNANVNASLDKMEDPAKMVDQYIRDAEAALGEVKARVADSITIAKKAEKKVENCKEAIETIKSFASAAVEAGNDEDLEKFITQKVHLEEHLEAYESAKTVADNNAAETRRIHDELQASLEEYKGKRDVIRSKSDVLKIKEQVVGITTLSNKTNSAFSNFARLEERLDEDLIKISVMEELYKPVDALANVKAKYDIKQRNKKIEDAITEFKSGRGTSLVPAKA